MSYILDALKKAESERQLGSVPGVHATPQDSSAHADETPFWRRNLPWLLVALLGLCLLAYVLWSQLGAKAPVALPPPVAAVTPEPVTATLPPAATSNAEEGSAPPSVAAPAMAPPVPKQALVTPAAITPPPKHAAADTPQAKTTEKAPAEVNAKVEAKPGASAPAAAVTDAAEQSIGTAQDLPPNIQRELPQISVNGYIYAKNPDDRSVLMNRKLLREGDTVAPDLVLEKLLPKGAILNYKGYRYRVAF